MILVLLGTQDKSFKRLLDEVQCCIAEGVITERVVVQAGETKFKSDKMEVFSLIPKDKLERLIIEARIVITHAGVGSILECVKMGKKVITAAREKKYKEHTNDHQLQLQKRFEENGHIIALKDVSQLRDALTIIENFQPVPYKSNTKQFIEKIEQYIDSID